MNLKTICSKYAVNLQISSLLSSQWILKDADRLLKTNTSRSFGDKRIFAEAKLPQTNTTKNISSTTQLVRHLNERISVDLQEAIKCKIYKIQITTVNKSRIIKVQWVKEPLIIEKSSLFGVIILKVHQTPLRHLIKHYSSVDVREDYRLIHSTLLPSRIFK